MDETRFVQHYRVVESGCWEWTGTVYNGYAYIRHEGTRMAAHRWSYEHFVGPIPPGFVIDHICHKAPCPGGSCIHRRCVNPDHLEAVTSRENLHRNAKSWQTHCKRGHELSGDNLRLIDGGRRQCVTCQNDRARDSARRKKSYWI